MQHEASEASYNQEREPRLLVVRKRGNFDEQNNECASNVNQYEIELTTEFQA